MQRVTEGAATLQLGAGIGYDFSTLRPAGSRVALAQTSAAGPVSFMRLFDALSPCLGAPRNRQIALLRVDHPDCELFVRSCPPWMRLGVAVTDAFMEAVARGTAIPLQWGGTVDARALWEIIMRAAWERGDLAIVFIDVCNAKNPLRYCEALTTLEPTTLAPLPPHGGILGGAVPADVDFTELEVALRALDNAIDKAVYPLPSQGEAAKASRRLAIGLLSPAEPSQWTGLELTLFELSAKLAVERGPFPQFGPPFLKNSSMPKELTNAARKTGVRHGQLVGPSHPDGQDGRFARLLLRQPTWEVFKQTFADAWRQGYQVLVVSVQP
jgi:ribonucleoside-diphosphate reductase alpha chain